MVWRGDRGLWPGPGGGQCLCRTSTAKMALGGFRSLAVCPGSGSGQEHRFKPCCPGGDKSQGVEAPQLPRNTSGTVAGRDAQRLVRGRHTACVRLRAGGCVVSVPIGLSPRAAVLPP